VRGIESIPAVTALAALVNAHFAVVPVGRDA
jgi:hypothetical protein